MVAEKFPGWKEKIRSASSATGDLSTRMIPGWDRVLVRVTLGLMIAVYSPEGIRITVRVVELGMGLVS